MNTSTVALKQVCILDLSIYGYDKRHDNSDLSRSISSPLIWEDNPYTGFVRDVVA